MKEVIKKILRESLLKENNQIITTKYDHPSAIDGTTFTKEGGKLTIAKFWKDLPHGIVELFVDDNHRRKGIATDLINHAIKFYPKGFTAQVSNLNSLDLHFKLGFRSFDDNLNIEDHKTTKDRLTKNSSVMMASPNLLNNLTEFYS